jgi:hypothetical protein
MRGDEMKALLWMLGILTTLLVIPHQTPKAAQNVSLTSMLSVGDLGKTRDGVILQVMNSREALGKYQDACIAGNERDTYNLALSGRVAYVNPGTVVRIIAVDMVGFVPIYQVQAQNLPLEGWMPQEGIRRL